VAAVPIRQQVTQYLAEQGAVEDPAGGATGALRKALGYEGSAAGFTQLIAAMDRAGELTRSVKGKRTFRIGPESRARRPSGPEVTREENPESTSEEDPDSSDLDYDELAGALLVRVVQALNPKTAQQRDDGSWAGRRIERLQRRIDDLERELARAKAEGRALTDERDGLRRQLELSEGNLALLTDRFAQGQRHATSVADRLGADERTLLQQLRRPSVNRQPERAS
jgi:hypothetical protein